MGHAPAKIAGPERVRKDLIVLNIRNECYSSSETNPIEREDQCQDLTCYRNSNWMLVGCPPGCLCVVPGPDSVVNANGTCYQIYTKPTTTPSPPSEESEDKK
ncbi:complement inhibitor RaCI7-like [Dermacentor albipictus]|uniref:complement inhibitor RaCI7-like n=1 Tax=Dermacentor albipictus TaxID=60249 RepID=UPI0038FBF309